VLLKSKKNEHVVINFREGRKCPPNPPEGVSSLALADFQ
jgi:hypothetical protein